LPVHCARQLTVPEPGCPFQPANRTGAIFLQAFVFGVRKVFSNSNYGFDAGLNGSSDDFGAIRIKHWITQMRVGVDQHYADSRCQAQAI
jgi:hypothetical protein